MVGTQDQLFTCILKVAAQINKSKLRRTTCNLHTRDAKYIGVDCGIFEY